MSLLVLDGVSKSFGGLKAVDEVSFGVEAGRITGLIGPNGAGKTTLVNLISGLALPSAGRITFDGRDITTIEPHRVARAGIARTFQTIRLLPEASVLANVAIGFHRHEQSSLVASLLLAPSAWRETARFEAAALALLDRFGMRRFADLPAGRLSYGHQRRVEMMRALATAPRLLLLDEPVAGMNDAEAESLGEMFRGLADDGRAILLIEHNIGFVLSLSDELHALDAGKLIASGAPCAVRSHPAVVAAYLGA
ncbi:ABC transporter ATP-binding protein [Blastochloris viridis]|uniref:Branched-chain amino acid transport ATP-binding protein LivG n=1 Tax=Blastochloris viridis TaxID=1079 RepID=A0A0H5BDJ5_BLAVI|nr:ABC transporter ATP-binding protein [Blastochloris viridis]ALK09801.1 Lipopolysaccharide export system ATP-binding protein LptB [Blastochloris viridis]BAS00298.1 branched-chain amino acid transport ATP-binding protein LivG [Blastochloris viridis]CUU42464.1 Lipopolysaccharide export system ATP-binding protein LptB [Blastochloris viridis]